MKEEKTLNLLDYLTAGIIANSFPFLWNYATFYLPILDYLSFIIYVMGGVAASYLVCNKATNDYYKVGLISSIISWLTTMFVQYNLFIIKGPIFVVILLVSYSVGGYIGVYFYQREKNKQESRKETEIKEPLDEEDSIPQSEELQKDENINKNTEEEPNE
ncbi:hypothetical protein JW865_07230 [Candidatus Bathyarchaeota archaeon]|nr:hypothetical protein [Candidatus Bathyarchaeota archaeon]